MSNPYAKVKSNLWTLKTTIGVEIIPSRNEIIPNL